MTSNLSATAILTDTSTWSGDILTALETNVQLALNKLNSYLETNTSFINDTVTPGGYSQVRLGYFNNIDAATEGALIVGSGPVVGTGPSISTAAYGSICIGNGYNFASMHGPSSVAPYCICVGTGAQTTGTHGIAVGYQSRAFQDCIALGVEALTNNTGGVSCTAIGSYALQTNNGGYNTAVGSNSMANTENCTQNTALGIWSLHSATGADYNVAIGADAMIGDPLFKSTGDYNVAIGWRALRCNTAVLSSSYNVGIGQLALSNLTTGGYNVGIGYQAGDLITTGGSNICIGNDTDVATAGTNYGINIGSNNGGVGTNSISIGRTIISSLDQNVSIGCEVTNAHYWATAIGYKATTTGAYAGGISIGCQAESQHLWAIAIGSEDVSSPATRTIAFGVADIAIGRNAQTSVSNYNIAIGEASRVSAANSTAIGREATCQADESIAMGYKSLASGSGGIAIGMMAKAESQYCIAIGPKDTSDAANRTLAYGTNGIAIGSGAQTTVGSFHVALGSHARCWGWAGYSVALGDAATCTDGSSIALGRSSMADGIYSIAIGYLANASGQDSCAIGRSCSSGVGQFTIGPQLADCRYYDSTGWTNLSDERAKDQIELVEEDCVGFIKKLILKRFEMKAQPGRKHIGFVAQDVLELLTEDEKKNTKFVQYDEKDKQYYLALQPIFLKHIKATQALMDRIEALEARLIV